MSDFIIYTDSGCDIKPEILKEWGVYYSCLSFRFDGDETEYSNEDMGIHDFYDRMRDGGVAKTSAVNLNEFATEFERILQSGKDILCLGFSSALSTTYNSACMAAAELAEKYPERRVVTVDTLAASAGQGMLVYMAVQKKNGGASLEETAAYAEDMKLHICHWVTLDELTYLKRGGRISATSALLGGMLGIKPIIHVDNGGSLVSVSKVRGRKKALAHLAAKYSELAKDPENGTVFICHSECPEDVAELTELIKGKHGAKVDIVTDIGPVIGAHTGPGTIALFFVGSER